MDRRLYEASLRGDVRSLMELHEENQLVLDKVIIRDFYGTTPLHIAAIRSHVYFVVKLLELKRELISELDSEGFYPLHLASAEKNVDVVKVLLGANSDICSATDQDGRTPLHLAAMKGRVEIMKVLIQARPEAIQVSDRRETILHLSVKHNRLEALKLLVEHLLQVEAPIGDQEESKVSVNSKDNDGNTILHLAVARRQMKIIEYLVDSNIGTELNALNNKGFTALDILTHSIETRGFKDNEIGDLLRDAGVLSRVSRQHELGESWIDNHDQTEQQTQQGRNSIGRQTSNQYYDSWLKDKQNTLIVVASLIATIGFQAGTNPTGGVWGGDGNEYPMESENVNTYDSPSPAPGNIIEGYKYAGTSIMAYNDADNYAEYMKYNTIGFVASLSIILLIISGLRPVKRKYFVGLLIFVLWVSITCMALTYFFALRALVPTNQEGVFYLPTIITKALLVWLLLLAFLVFGHFIQFIRWLLRKLGILKQEEAGTRHRFMHFISWLPKKLGILKQEEVELAYVRNGY